MWWRITVRYFGRVQGVGFRWQVREVARKHECTGYARNLPDGSVELLVEGKYEVCRRMVGEVDGRMKKFWLEKKEDARVGEAHFNEFSIRR